MKRFKIQILLTLIISSFAFAQQGGGMWIPTELNEEEMKQMGMNISASDIFDPNAPSIKDAVAHFGGGCTSEVISPKGLLLTNHHCGYGEIQSHSSLENDYLKNGFWAKNLKEELPNKNLTATFIVDIKEVTQEALEGVRDDMLEDMRQNWIKSNIEKIIKETQKESYQDIFVRPFYKGNKYYLFVTETYKDVRLVGAPPSAIGKFGSDTDNWMWPRHTGDFSLFRIYADKNNKPAEYSPNNVPYKPKYFLPISIKGTEENDFTFVFGFPGTTDEYLPAIALEQIQNSINPERIAVRELVLKILDSKMRKDDATRIKYASKYAGISNAWKKWIGEIQGLKESNAVEKRKLYEEDFLNELSKNPDLQTKYASLIPNLEELYDVKLKYELASNLFDEALYRNSETFRIALLLSNLLKFKGNETGFEEYKSRIVSYLGDLYKNYDSELDSEVSLALHDWYTSKMPEEFLPSSYEKLTENDFKNSIITGNKKVNNAEFNKDISLAFSDSKALIKALENDPIIHAIGLFETAYSGTVSHFNSAFQNQKNYLQREYMKAQLEVFPDKKFFPDANSTLRVTYGKIDGYKPEGKPRYEAKTYLDGVIAKYKPGDYEFDLPKKLLDLHKNKNYGEYAENGKMPVNFIATNHTTGGNSGSPALDADGNLIGINFDRVWEGTMSDYNYDASICRNIMVDIRYVLFIIDKYADAKHLIKEMKIIK